MYYTPEITQVHDCKQQQKTNYYTSKQHTTSLK